MVFRRLDRHDEGQLLHLVDIVESSLVHPKFWLPIDDTSYNHFLDDAWTVFFGAFDGKALVAAAGLFLNEHEYGESLRHVRLSARRVAELGRIMCRPEYRGCGLPTMLARMAVCEASRRGCDAIVATAHPDNAPSQALLAKLGFEQAGHVVKGGDFPREILCLRLGEPDGPQGEGGAS